MEMSFPFDIADSNLADGHLDHKVLLALAISRQASGATARLMLRSAKGYRHAKPASLVDPLTARIGYFSNALKRNAGEFNPSGGFYIPREKCTDQRFSNNESSVYQDVSANRKQSELKECKSDTILVPTGQENLRHI